MTFKAFVFLFVLHSTASKKTLTELKHTKISSNPAIDSKCLQIVANNLAECPAVEAPLCVKMKYMDRNSNQTVYMSLINRCELNYVKCYHDIKVEEVSMKYCDQHYFENTKIHKIIPSKKRSKRSFDENPNEADSPDNCPPSNLMACARCTHGIYKTFMSVCHIKKFAFKYPKEKMELISRYPCMFSSPYWSKSGRYELEEKATDTETNTDENSYDSPLEQGTATF